MMKRSKAEELGLTILGKHCFTSVAGLAPRIMGIGPSYAIPRLLKMAGLTKEDVDLWEVNEAFASMYTYMVSSSLLPLLVPSFISDALVLSSYQSDDWILIVGWFETND